MRPNWELTDSEICLKEMSHWYRMVTLVFTGVNKSVMFWGVCVMSFVLRCGHVVCFGALLVLSLVLCVVLSWVLFTLTIPHKCPAHRTQNWKKTPLPAPKHQCTCLGPPRIPALEPELWTKMYWIKCSDVSSSHTKPVRHKKANANCWRTKQSVPKINRISPVERTWGAR